MAHILLIGVQLEDLLLGETLLQFNGDQDFCQLPLELLFPGEEEAPGHLHGNSRAALPISTLAQVDPSGLHEPPVIDTTMEEEAAIFNRGYGVHHHFRDVV